MEKISLKEKAIEFYNSGYSCSESIIKAIKEQDLINENINIEILNKIASAFSGGIGYSGCLCGAVAASEISLGLLFGRKNKTDNTEIKDISKNFIDEFKKRRKATCCKALSAGYEFNSPERRTNCASIVGDAGEILERIIYSNQK